MQRGKKRWRRSNRSGRKIENRQITACAACHVVRLLKKFVTRILQVSTSDKHPCTNMARQRLNCPLGQAGGVVNRQEIILLSLESKLDTEIASAEGDKIAGLSDDVRRRSDHLRVVSDSRRGISHRRIVATIVIAPVVRATMVMAIPPWAASLDSTGASDHGSDNHGSTQ
jgi:hypothetical protein